MRCSHLGAARGAIDARGFEAFDERRNHDARVTHDSDLRREIAAHRFRRDVDVDQIRRHPAAETAGGDFAEAGADGKQAVAPAERVFGGRHRGAAEAHAGVQRMIAGKGRQALQRGGDGRPQHFRNRRNRTRRRPPRPSRRRCRVSARRPADARPRRFRARRARVPAQCGVKTRAAASTALWKSWMLTGISTSTGPGTPLTAVLIRLEDRGHDLRADP